MFFWYILELNIFVIIFVILCLALYERKYEPENFYNVKSVKHYIWFVVICLNCSWFFVFSNVATTILYNDNIAVYHDFISDSFIIFWKCFLVFITSVALILSYDFLKTKDNYIEYIIFVLLALEGMLILLSANNFIIAYLAIELQAFCFYAIFALAKYKNVIIEASLKYFILSSFASAVLIFGITFIYGSCGSISFAEVSLLSESLSQNFFNLYNAGILFFFVGILFKLAIVPFHYWIGDIYEGLAMEVVMLYATLSKIPYVIFLIRIMEIMTFSVIIIKLLFYLSLLSIIFGSLAALYQTNLMRLLAFGAINHIGFILIGISLNTIDGIVSSLVYLFVYTILLIGFFSIILLLKSLGVGGDYLSIVNIIKFSQLSKSHFFFSVIFTTFILSFAGIPPFAGFFIKWGIFLCLIESGNYLSLFLISFFSIVSAVYYLRLLRFMFFFKNTNKAKCFWFEFNYLIISFIIFCFFFNFIFFFFQSHFYYILLFFFN